MPKHLTEKDLVISSIEPVNPKHDCIWINADSGLIQVFYNKRWTKLGYYNTAEIDSKIAELNVSLNRLYEAKVDKVPGKVLSSNNFTKELKDKLDSVDDGANRYVHPSGDGYLHMTEEQKERWTNNDAKITSLNKSKADSVRLENNFLSLYSNDRKISSVEIPRLSEIHNINAKIEEFKKEFIDQTFTSFGYGSNLDCNNTLEGVVQQVLIRGTGKIESVNNMYRITCSDTRDVVRSERVHTCEFMLKKGLRGEGNTFDTIELVDNRYCAIYRVGNAKDEIVELSKDIDLALKNIKTYNNYTKIKVTSELAATEIKVHVATTLITNILNLFVNIQGIDEQMSLLEFAAMTMALNLEDIEEKIKEIGGSTGNE